MSEHVASDAQLDHLNASLLPLNVFNPPPQAKFGSIHHLTHFPESLKEGVALTVESLEQQLKQRIEALTSRDSDRYRQVLKIWREHSKKEGGDYPGSKSNQSYLTKSQFLSVLKVLGLFATREQSDKLFDLYDTNGDGRLTVYEFFRHSRGVDYQKRKRPGPPPMKPQKLSWTRPSPGENEVAPWSMEGLFQSVRDKCRINNPVAFSVSYPKARRDLAMSFEYFDKKFNRYVNEAGLVRTLNAINFSIHPAYLSLLMRRFPAKPLRGETGELFAYPEFILKVFPIGERIETSLKIRSAPPPAILAQLQGREGRGRRRSNEENYEIDNDVSHFMKGRGGSGALTAREPSRPSSQHVGYRPHASRPGGIPTNVRIVGGRLVRTKVDPALAMRMGTAATVRLDCALVWKEPRVSTAPWAKTSRGRSGALTSRS